RGWRGMRARSVGRGRRHKCKITGLKAPSRSNGSMPQPFPLGKERQRAAAMRGSGQPALFLLAARAFRPLARPGDDVLLELLVRHVVFAGGDAAAHRDAGLM